MTDIQGLPGFRDFYPEDLAVRAYLTGVWRDVARWYGFEEYDGPPLEELELYRRKSGDEIVQQLYEFEDKGGRHIALRPEMTPTLARMVGARARALRKPVRWYSIPQLFRYERKQRGRTREHFQLNMDIIGEADVLADAELLAAAIDICRVAGLDASQVRARVSDRRVLAAVLRHVGVPAADLDAVYEVIDKLDRERRDRIEEKLTDIGLDSDAVAAVIEATGTRGMEKLKARYGGVAPVAEAIAELDRYLEHLDDLGVVEFVDIDLSVVRGLAYYTGIVFELWDARRELRAICGGGRYDNLLELLSGVDMPALGFGMGDVVLGELLADHELLPDRSASVDCFVAYIGPVGRRHALQMARRLRDAGFSTIYDFRERRLGNQLKSANQLNADVAIILGPQEVEAGQARIRRMSSGEEHVVAFEDVVGTLRQDGEHDG